MATLTLKPRGRGVVLVAAAAAVACAGSAQGATPPPALATALADWTDAHPATSALVWRLDEAGPQEILSFGADVARQPASTMKIVTAASALVALGPDFQFQTRLYAGEQATQDGDTLTGPLYVKGYGDPTLSTAAYSSRYLGGVGANVVKLVRPLRDAGIRKVNGPLVVDETFFDSVRRGVTWPARYATECQPLSAMSINQSWLGDRRRTYVKSPPKAAAAQVRIAMKRIGVTQTGRVAVAPAPARGRLIATVNSPRLRVITRLMLPDSDNFLAEMLMKDVGAYTSGTGSTAAGTRAAATLLGQYLSPDDRLVDGSGLDTGNRLTASSLVRTLAAAEADATWGSALIDSLPKGGEGTLKRRFLATGLRPRVRAKTGYIRGTSALAGVVESTAGTRYAFAFLMNQGSVTAAHATQDRLVTLLAAGVADSAT